MVVAGDMNTSTHNGVPISVTRALKQRFGSGKWWAEQGASQAARYATQFGWAYNLTLGLVGFARKVDDPTRASIPLAGDKEHSYNGRTGRLANSNERGEKGFVPTNELGKT